MADAAATVNSPAPESSDIPLKDGEEERPMAPNWFRLGYLIHDVSRMRRTLFDQHMKPEGITRSQWWLLANLSRHPGIGVMSTELSKILDVGKVTLGGLVDRLEIAGYVYRRPDKMDRRAKRIFITDAGYALIERMRVITENLNKEICRALNPEEVEAVEARLFQIKGNLRCMLSDEVPPESDPLDVGK